MTTTTTTEKAVLRFQKMHGIGNDFVVFDAVSTTLPRHDRAALARAMCDRRFGVGADGTIYVEQEGDRFRMRMFNPDGSESEMCGNGIRCVARLIRDAGLSSSPTIPVETGAGTLVLEFANKEEVRVDMGLARFKRGEIGVTGAGDDTFVLQEVSTSVGTFVGTAVSMGNPHLVVFVDDVSAIDLERVGPVIENHPMFPARINVHFVQVVDRNNLIQRTWERGAGVTLACGTGACACAVAAYTVGLAERNVTIKLPGGTLKIEYAESSKVFMTGPAEQVFEGAWILG